MLPPAKREGGKVGAETMEKGDKDDLYDNKLEAAANFRLSSSSMVFGFAFLRRCFYTVPTLFQHLYTLSQTQVRPQ